jgi:hypothetical protein
VIQFGQPLSTFFVPFAGGGSKEAVSLVAALGYAVTGVIHVAQSKLGRNIAVGDFSP